MTQVWETSLPSAEKMVLLVIADHANDDGSDSWPGVKTIARKCSISERSAQRHIRSLEARGIIWIAAQRGGNRNTRHDRRPNRYDINLGALNGVTICRDEVDGVTDETERGDNYDITGCQTEQNGVTPVSPYPSLSIHEPSENHPAELVADWESTFEQWWKMQPRKVAKDKARKLWQKMTDTERDLAIEVMPYHVEHWRASKTEAKFIPHPPTWLNQRRWEDELVSDYKPQGSLVEQISRYALTQRRQENRGRRASDDSPRGLGSGDDRLE